MGSYYLIESPPGVGDLLAESFSFSLSLAFPLGRGVFNRVGHSFVGFPLGVGRVSTRVTLDERQEGRIHAGWAGVLVALVGTAVAFGLTFKPVEYSMISSCQRRSLTGAT